MNIMLLEQSLFAVFGDENEALIALHLIYTESNDCWALKSSNPPSILCIIQFALF